MRWPKIPEPWNMEMLTKRMTSVNINVDNLAAPLNMLLTSYVSWYPYENATPFTSTKANKAAQFINLSMAYVKDVGHVTKPWHIRLTEKHSNVCLILYTLM